MINRKPVLVSFFLASCVCHSLAPSCVAKQNSSAPATQPRPSTSSQAGASGTNRSVRPKKVYTEDDLRSSGSSASSAPGEVDLSDINNCDRSCRAELLKGLVTPGNWDADKGLARAVEGIRGDFQWQAALHAYARYRVKFCELEKEKGTAEYTRKEKALGDEMRRKVRTRWSDPYWIGNDPLLNLEDRFTIYQVGRIMVAPCPTSSDR